MKLFQKVKDGGPDSPVDGYFLIEMKSLFSVAVLKFNKGARVQYHTHAFNAFTWFLSGQALEEDFDGSVYNYHQSVLPKVTLKTKNHRVIASKDSWCFTIRGPWDKTWTEDDKDTGLTTTFTHGRVILKNKRR